MTDDRWLTALAVSAVASSVAGLLVPLYLVRLGGGAAQLGVNAAVSSLVGAPAAVLAGRYADRTGNRRGVVLAALSVAAVALVALPFIATVPAVIAVNGVLAFALAAIGPVVTMLVVGDSPEAAWNARIARLNTLQGYGSTGGLVLGTVWLAGVGAVATVGVTQETLFGLGALFGVAAAVVAYRSLPRHAPLALGPRRSGRVATLLSRTSRNVRDDAFSFGTTRVFWAARSLSPAGLAALRARLPTALWLYFAGAALFFTGFSVFWAPLPVFLTDRAGFGTGVVFALYLVNNVASTVLYDRAGALAGSRDVRFVQGGALGLRAVAFLAVGALGVAGAGLFAAGGPVPLLVVGALLAVVGVTWAVVAVAGTAIVSRFAPADARGGVLGVYAALSAVAGALGGLLGGWVASHTYALAFGLAAALVIAGGAVVVLTHQLSVAPTASTPPEPSRPTE
ncbi:MAG: MFS transporter [Haloarculaceae archaeon]